MTVNEFFTKYNGKGLDYDGFYGFQCMDLYQQYNQEVIGGPHFPANAYQVWNTHPQDLYSRVENTPEGIPQLGDIIIWNKNTGGGYGHIAIFKEGDANSFLSFDQNWPVGSVCHFQTHNYTNVIGWLRPNSAIIAQPIAHINEYTDQTKIPANLLGTTEDMEIQALRGKLSDLEIAQKQVKGMESNLSKLTGKLIVANDEIEILESREKTTGKELKESLTNINKLNKELETQRELYNNLLKAYNALKSGDSADDNHLPPPIQIITFPPIIQSIVNWFKKWFR